MLTFFHAYLETLHWSRFLREGYRVCLEQIPTVQQRGATQCTRSLEQGKANSKVAVSVPLSYLPDPDTTVHSYGPQAVLH